jgi:hypothetical protein
MKRTTSSPLAVFALPIRTSRKHRGRKKLTVYIWQNLRDLRRAAQKSSTLPARWWKTAAGAYVGVVTKTQFGEIHLWQKLIGAGYFAHELQHFMEDYRTATEGIKPLDDEANERMAWLAGELTAEFWTKFYEKFEVKQKGCSDARAH